jgi:hypothetical protein
MGAELEYYMIRSTITGAYSNGGSCPSFTKHGKIWKAIGPLKSHLRLVANTNKSLAAYKHCEIVSLKLSSGPCNTKLEDVIDALEKDLIVRKLKGIA